MQVYATTINEILEHVHHSIAGQVSRKLIKQLGITDLIKNHMYIESDFLGASKSSNESRLPILNENAFRCNVKYSMNPFGLKWDSTTPGQHMDPAIHRKDCMRTTPVFYDPQHNIQLIERYIPCNIELECSVIFVDRVLAFDVMTRLMSTYVRGELLMVNDLSYDYRLPTGVLSSLYLLGRTIGLQKGTYLDWLMQGSHGMIQRKVSTRQTNQHAELVIKKQQFNTLASIDYQGDSPIVQGVGSSMDTVALQFNVNIQFGRVNMLYLKYPIVLNNNLIPESLVTTPKEESYGELWKYIRHPYLAMDGFHQLNKTLLAHPARNPWFDDWLPPPNCALTADYIRPFFIGVFTIDNTNCHCNSCECDDCGYKYTEINIETDIDQYKLAPNVLQWFKDNPDDALSTYSKYNITVFRDNIQVGESMLQFDGTTLKFPNCRCAHGIYHLVIGASMKNFNDGCPWNMLLLTIDVETEKKEG